MKKTLDDYLNDLSPDAKTRVDLRADQILQETTLRALRKALEQSQHEMAIVLKVKQAEISKMERRTDMLISTLSNYLHAMGGSLVIIAQLPNGNPVKITQFQQLHEGIHVKAQERKTRAVKKKVLAKVRNG